MDDISIIPDLPDEDTCQSVVACRGSHSPTKILPHLQVRAHFIDIVRSSRLFLEASTSIGYAFCGFMPGDEIWALDGARLPFILRKTGHKTFQIVSDCYLWEVREP